MGDEEKQRVPVADLEPTEEWKQLTMKQKMFCQTYIASNYDQVYATTVAFRCKTQENARVLSYAILRNPKIVAVMSIHFARDPREDWLKMLERAAKNRNITKAQLDAILRFGEMRGFTGAIPKSLIRGEDQKPRVEKPKKERKPRKRPAKETVENPYGDWTPAE